ncbi:MAG: hypothetical protein PHR51_00995 [Patescibacteria group bacterium]|nr:hypothetical protein [Patescibacteria group bacterium]
MGSSQLVAAATKEIAVSARYSLPRCVCFFGGWLGQPGQTQANIAARTLLLAATGDAAPFGLPLLVQSGLYGVCDLEVDSRRGKPLLAELSQKRSRWLTDPRALSTSDLYSYRAELETLEEESNRALFRIVFFRIYDDNEGQHKSEDVLETYGYLVPRTGFKLVPATVAEHEFSGFECG